MTERVQTSPQAAAVPNWRPYVALLVGVMAASTAAIFIRLSQEAGAPSLVLAAARLSIATIILTPLVLRRHWAAVRAVSVSDMKWALVSGVVLGLHFATWITSLEYTAVVNSVTLVTTTPLWVAIMAPIFLGEKLDRWAVAGLILALCGGILVGLSGEAGNPPVRSAPLLGNSLAVIGAIMAGIYFMIGRRLRARLNLTVYIWLVYGTAAIILALVVLVSGEQVGGLPDKAYLWMLMLGLVPQLIGHSSFNYALGFLTAAYVSLVMLGEPISSGLLAIIFLNEWPVWLQLVGSALILVGIGVASKEDLVRKTETPPEI
jgi:drug/metabolite transporter (DMT)-like permease